MPENYGYVIHACLMFVFENTACFSTFVKMSLYNSEVMQCILVCFLKKSVTY